MGKAAFASTLAIVLLGSCNNLLAQATQVAQIAGVVQDQSGAAVTDARIALTNTETGIVRETVSGTDGAYTLPNLPPGSYRLAVTRAGFAGYTQSGIQLQVNTNPQINVVLNWFEELKRRVPSGTK